MTVQDFADFKECKISKVHDATLGRGKQRLHSTIVPIKGKGNGSRLKLIILDELSEKFEGGFISQKYKLNAVDKWLRFDRVDFNRPVEIEFGQSI
ncbi:MAG: hypothetical protein PVH88_02035 [Ignavibacteria bacterium]